MINLRKKSSFEQDWIFFTHECFVPSWVEILTMGLEKKNDTNRQYILILKCGSILEKKLNSLYPKMLYISCGKIGPVVSGEEVLHAFRKTWIENTHEQQTRLYEVLKIFQQMKMMITQTMNFSASKSFFCAKVSSAPCHSRCGML